jgi:hypothetical protein
MKIGVAKVDITPGGPIRLAGYSGRSAEATEVAQRLFAKALAIEAADGSLRVLITADMFGIADQHSDELAQRLKKRTGLERAQLAVAPFMFDGPIPEDHQQRVRGYVHRTGNWQSFQTRAVGHVALAAGKHVLTLKPAQDFSDGALMDLREIQLVPAGTQATEEQ